MKKNILFLVVLLIYFFNCKNTGKEITFKNQISESEINKNDFIQINIDSVYYDEKNSYFKINIENKSRSYLYFPVDPDFSSQFNDRASEIKSNFSFSTFYTKYFDQNNFIILGHLYSSDIVIDFWKKIDSLKIENSNYLKKYGKVSDSGFKDRIYWGVKYHEVKKNGFFLKPKEEKELIIRSHISFDIKAHYYDQTSFSSKELEKVAYAQLILYIDSSQIKRDLLLSKDIDSLRKNNIKIFHGTIYSNKVPLKLKQ